MPRSNQLSRRAFLDRSATAGAVGAAAPYFVSAAALGQAGKPVANDRIQLGLIGCGGMGRGNLARCAEHDDVEVTAVCDVWKERRDVVLKTYKETAKPHTDYRELYRDPWKFPEQYV